MAELSSSTDQLADRFTRNGTGRPVCRHRFGGDATGAGLGLTADIGVAIHGTPDVALRATGPISGNSVFQADLESELHNINDEIKAFKVYPILNLGLSFGL